MAFPASQGTPAESSTNTAGTSHVITLPASIQAGELLVVIIDKGSTAATFNALAGWSELLDENLGNGIAILYRWADGTEGASITLTSSASTRSARIAYRISGAHPSTPPTLGTVGTGTSVSPDPGNCNPGVAKDYLWITLFGGAGEEADDDTWANTPPADFTGLLQKACGTAGTNLGGKIAVAGRNLNAASLDAGTFSQDVSTAWRAYTIAIHPSPYVTGAGSAAGVAASAVLGAALFLAAASGSGIGAASGVGVGLNASQGVSAGLSTASAVGDLAPVVVSGAGSGAGLGAASGLGASIAGASGAAGGAATPAAIGESSASGQGAGEGTSTASGTGAATAEGTASGAGQAPAMGVGAWTSGAPASASGQATGAGVGESTSAGEGLGTGTSTAGASSATGGTTSEATGAASGTASAEAAGWAILAGVGTGAGSSSVLGEGASTQAALEGVGASSGTATSLAVGASTHAGVGLATGIATASAATGSQAEVTAVATVFSDQVGSAVVFSDRVACTVVIEGVKRVQWVI